MLKERSKHALDVGDDIVAEADKDARADGDAKFVLDTVAAEAGLRELLAVDGDRLEECDGRDLARLFAGGVVDAGAYGFGGSGWELVGKEVLGMMVGAAHAFPDVGAIELDNEAIGGEGELDAATCHILNHLLNVVGIDHDVGDGGIEAEEPEQRRSNAVRDVATTRDADARMVGHFPREEHEEGIVGRGVVAVEDGRSCGACVTIGAFGYLFEIGKRHEHLATDLDTSGGPDGLGDAVHLLHMVENVLALLAVAASAGFDELAVEIDEGTGHAIVLPLDSVVDVGDAAADDVGSADAGELHPMLDVADGLDLLRGEHGGAVGDGVLACCGIIAYALCGRIGQHSVGVSRLVGTDGEVQLVELSIGDFGSREDEVAMVMITGGINGAAVVGEGEDGGGGGVEELHSGMGVKGLRGVKRGCYL